MQLGVGVGQARWASERGLSDAVSQFFEVTRAAEELGLYSVWVGDHILFPADVDYTRSRYPMTPTGRLAIDTQSTMFEAVTLLATLAGSTRRVKLGTSVLVLPYRHPILTAKMLATVDALSGGRLVVGVGVGWLGEEFDALGAASFEARGALTDEYLRILKILWTQPRPSFNGRWYHFDGFGFEPHPVQKPHPPIWIGGASVASLRRVARFGDGWHPSHIPPATYAHQLARLRQLMIDEGRQLDEITLSANIQVVIDPNAHGTELTYLPQPESSARFVGNPAQVVATLRQYQALGVQHVALNLSMSADGSPRQPGSAPTQALEILARDVIPALDAEPSNVEPHVGE